jgi:hypothetical protein
MSKNEQIKHEKALIHGTGTPAEEKEQERASDE